MPSDTTPPAANAATLTVTDLPAGDLPARVLALANAAKGMTWHGMDENGAMPEDHMFVRAALALVHMLESSEVMSTGPALVALLSSSFTVVDNDPPKRAELLAARLYDPSKWVALACMNNRRLLGLPPQISLVPDEGASS